MLIQFFSTNFSFIVALLYFSFYSVSLFLFFICLAPFLNVSNNLNYLSRLCRYDRFLYGLLICSIFSLVGVPPLCLFAPKFAGLMILWVNSAYFFFFFAFLLTILSFTVYIQIFDLLFSWNHQFNDSCIEMKYVQLIRSIPIIFDVYSKRMFILSFAFVTVFGFFWFKDFFFLISIFV